MSPRPEIRVLLLMAALAVLIVLAETVTGIDAGLLHLAPALFLALPLLAGRYVGEEQLAALVAARRSPEPVVARIAARLPRAPRVTMARGGALLAAALAERGPPALAQS